MGRGSPGAGQALRARRGLRFRGPQELPVPNGVRAGLRGDVDGLRLPTAEPQCEDCLRVRRELLHLTPAAVGGRVGNPSAQPCPERTHAAVPCWNCKNEDTPGTLACSRCGKAQAVVAGATYFDAFGLQPAVD